MGCSPVTYFESVSESIPSVSQNINNTGVDQLLSTKVFLSSASSQHQAVARTHDIGGRWASCQADVLRRGSQEEHQARCGLPTTCQGYEGAKVMGIIGAIGLNLARTRGDRDSGDRSAGAIQKDFIQVTIDTGTWQMTRLLALPRSEMVFRRRMLPSAMSSPAWQPGTWKMFRPRKRRSRPPEGSLVPHLSPHSSGSRREVVVAP